MKKFSSVLFGKLMYVVFFMFLGLIVILGAKEETNYVANIGSATSLQAANFVVKYDDIVSEKLNVKKVSTINEVLQYGSLSPVSFTGEMTAYRADCQGCSGRVACPPSQDVRGDNIYYDDVSYGKVRILAADKRIPCGSIIRITNLTFTTEGITGIVLDRGGAIEGTLVDFLIDSSTNASQIGRQYNVNYEIVRWGW